MAESLQFSIGADTKSFTDGIGGAIGALAGLAAAFVSVQAITEAFNQAIDMGGRLHDLSTQTGETAGNLAILERAFDNTSVGAERLGPAIAKMQKSMIDMAEGSKESVAAFAQLGLTWADLEGKSPSEQLALIGVRLAAIQDPALRAQTAMEIFGRSGAELLPILTNFGEETKIAKEQLGSLPEQLDKTSGSVDELGDNLSAISNKLTELAYGFLSEVIPAVEAFIGPLSKLNAASIGADLADALVGAFKDPMKAASILGDTLLLGVKMMGNELIYQANYWSELLFNTFKIISSDLIPILGNNMTGAFGLAVGFLGDSLAKLLAPAAEFLGLDFVQELAAGSQELMTQGAAKIADSANQFANAMEQAKNQSTVIRQDMFGVQESSAKIASDWQNITASGKQLVEGMTVIGAPGPTPLTPMTDAERASVLAGIEAREKVDQEKRPKTTAAKAPTEAQIRADQQKKLGLIAAADPTQLIGQSASAQRVLDLQKELETMTAKGIETPGEQATAASLNSSIQKNLDVAFANTITSTDRETIRGMALDEYMKGSEMGISELEDQAEAALLEQKRANDPLFAQEQRKKAEEAAAGTAAAKEKPITMSSMVNTVIQILQKIEPKIPQHIMA